MQITAISPETATRGMTFDTLTAQRLDGVTALEPVLAHLDLMQQRDPAARWFCTLDDANQCAYTSGHARDQQDLSLDTDGMDWEDPLAVQAHALRELAYAATRLDDAPVAWDDVLDTLGTTPDDLTTLLALNRRPTLFLDDRTYVQRLPVARDDLLLAGIPNGYFSSDWNVFQNHAIARRLATHGYGMFGIGAALLGFRRRQPLAPDTATALATDLCALYGTDDPALHTAFREMVTAQPVLLLGYTESFAETAPRLDRS